MTLPKLAFVDEVVDNRRPPDTVWNLIVTEDTRIMRINNNIMAYSAQRNLGASAMSMGKSIEKLSSGLRINRAADDASGLVISQKLRAQTSGLRQATRNAQDGISVVQTAEGGLNEVHSMLNRMRDLAVQSANTGASDGLPAGRPGRAQGASQRDQPDR